MTFKTDNKKAKIKKKNKKNTRIIRALCHVSLCIINVKYILNI